MNLKGKDLDDFFRKELSYGDIPFEQAHWLRLEKRLAKKKRKHRIAWITISGIAAMLLLTLSVSDIFFKDQKAQPVAAVAKKSLNPTPPPSASLKDDGSRKQLSEDTGEENNTLTELDVQSKELRAGNISKRAENISRKKAPVLSEADPSEEIATQSVQSELNETGNGQLAASPPVEISQSIVQDNNQTGVLSHAGPTYAIQKQDTALASAKKPLSRGSAFSVSLLAGPDINGVNSLQSHRGGISVGVIMNYRLSKTLSISTGALYAKKLYNTEFAYYKPNSDYKFPVSPKQVNADCRVLDIPLNLSFTALSGSKNALAVSAGISSYLMLNEGYSFMYDSPSARGPRTYYITNRNKHYLGILNFGLAYERKVSDEVSIGFQPYLKLPITDIGYGNVKLLSTGILTSVRLSIPSKSK